MPVPCDDSSGAASVVAVVDVIHDFSTADGCVAGLVALDHNSEPLEFVFNSSLPGCSRVRFAGLWAAESARRAETRALLRSLFEACTSNPMVLVVLEATADVRLLSLDLKLELPCAVLRSDAEDVIRWLPNHPPDTARRAVEALVSRSPLAEAVARVRKGLDEAFLGTRSSDFMSG